MIALLLIALALTAWYNYLFIIPESLYATVDDPDRGPYQFTSYCLAVGMALLIPWVDMTPDPWRIIAFISCLGLMLAGLAPHLKTEFDNTIHYICLIVSFIFWVIWMVLVGTAWHLMPLTLIFMILCMIKKECWIYWAEITLLVYTNLYLLLWNLL